MGAGEVPAVVDVVAVGPGAADAGALLGAGAAAASAFTAVGRAGVGAGFFAVGAGTDVGAAGGDASEDDGCVADVLTPGSKSAGGGATGLPPCAQVATLNAHTVATSAPRTNQWATGCLGARIINLPP